jgi:hypothetical protein
LSRDDHSHDLIGAFQDLVNPQVAHQFFDAVICQIAIAAVQLQAVVDDP